MSAADDSPDEPMFQELARRLMRDEAWQETEERLVRGGAAAARALLDFRELGSPGTDPREVIERRMGLMRCAVAADTGVVLDELRRRGGASWELVAALGAATGDAVLVDAVVDALLPLLGVRDGSLRATAAQSLASIGTPRAVAALIPLIFDRAVSGIALAAMYHYLPAEAEEPLSRYLDRNNGHRYLAAAAMVELEARRIVPVRPPREVTPEVRRLVESGSSEGFRRDASEAAVRELLDGYYLPGPPRRERLGHEGILVGMIRKVATRDLAPVLSVLRERPEDAGPIAQALGYLTIAQPLGHLRGAPVERALIGMLAHPDPRARYNAVDALERLGTPSALAAIGTLTDDPSRGVRASAADAVARARYRAAMEEEEERAAAGNPSPPPERKSRRRRSDTPRARQIEPKRCRAISTYANWGRMKPTYDQVVLGTLLYEFSNSDKAEAEAKIRRLLMRRKLGAYAPERVKLLRQIKDILLKEITGRKSIYYVGPKGEDAQRRCAESTDFDVPRLIDDLGRKFPAVLRIELEAFVPFCVYSYYLR